MYKYSPIKKIMIRNFRNIGDAEIDFTDSPIVSLIGENEAGKTSVVKAFSVCALHSTPRDQKDFIRDGTQGFGIIIQLEDGTTVSRLKTSTANRYIINYPDGTSWDCNKPENTLPVEVQNVMGMTEEPETKEYLHVRTYEDQLLFVVTPASTNYKVMYDALKVAQLTQAINVGSKEVNALKSEINSNETGIETLRTSLRGIRTFDVTPLVQIKQRLTKELEVLNKLEKVAEIQSKIEGISQKLGAMQALINGEAKEINIEQAYKFNRVSNILSSIEDLNKRCSRFNDLDTLENIDTHCVSKMLNILNIKDNTERILSGLGALADIGKANEVNVSVVSGLARAEQLIKKLDHQEKMYRVMSTDGAELVDQTEFNAVLKMERWINIAERNKQLESAVTQLDDYCRQVEAYIKSLGAAVEICPKCGETVVIDIDKLSKQA